MSAVGTSNPRVAVVGMVGPLWTDVNDLDPIFEGEHLTGVILVAEANGDVTEFAVAGRLRELDPNSNSAELVL